METPLKCVLRSRSEMQDLVSNSITAAALGAGSVRRANKCQGDGVGMSKCECLQPGWCERHRCHKTVHWHDLCRTRSDYFALWERGNGPGQRLWNGPTGAMPVPSSVAVVIVCHNYGRFLQEAIESVLSQTRQADEIVIVDDASDDETAAVARQYGDRSRYVRIDARHVHSARAAGFLATTSEVICFLDADDRLADRKSVV